MTTVRRTYAYLLAFAGLAMLTISLADLVQLVVDVLLRPSSSISEAYVRNGVSVNAAGALVGLPVWLLHWLWTERTVRSDAQERASALRRLYLYVILAAAALVAALSMREVLVSVIDPLAEVRSPIPTADAILRPLPFTFIALVVWFAHWRVAARDRPAVDETGGSATLRRWYVYGLAYIGFLLLLGGAAGVLQSAWQAIVGPGLSGLLSLPQSAATALVGLGMWLVHWSVLPQRLPEQARLDDGRAVLRSVYLFLSLAVTIAGALLSASQVLYYAAARLLGVERPGGVGGDFLQAAAGPVSGTLIYAAGWAYQRQAVRHQAAVFREAPRQAGTRRLYTYLVALVALVVLATGVAGLLWTLGDVIFNAPAAASGGWRGQIALYATLTIVGLPVWALHWRSRPAETAESQSLARRLYVYLSLIGAMLTLVGSLAVALYRFIGLALGTPFNVEVITDLAHSLAVAIVGAIVAAYHWRVLRADARRAEAEPGVAREPPAAPELTAAPAPSASGEAQALVEIHADNAASLERALSALRQTGVQIIVR
jgi:hypothetical protein